MRVAATVAGRGALLALPGALVCVVRVARRRVCLPAVGLARIAAVVRPRALDRDRDRGVDVGLFVGRLRAGFLGGAVAVFCLLALADLLARSGVRITAAAGGRATGAGGRA